MENLTEAEAAAYRKAIGPDTDLGRLADDIAEARRALEALDKGMEEGRALIDRLLEILSAPDHRELSELIHKIEPTESPLLARARAYQRARPQ